MANFPLIVENELSQMDINEQYDFMEEYNRRKKSIFFGYLLLLFFGWHYDYVKNEIANYYVLLLFGNYYFGGLLIGSEFLLLLKDIIKIYLLK